MRNFGLCPSGLQALSHLLSLSHTHTQLSSHACLTLARICPDVDTFLINLWEVSSCSPSLSDDSSPASAAFRNKGSVKCDIHYSPRLFSVCALNTWCVYSVCTAHTFLGGTCAVPHLVLTMWVRSESAGGDPRVSLGSDTYRMLGFSLAAMLASNGEATGDEEERKCCGMDGWMDG